jgi:arylsulfatase A-like enzyme
MNRKKQLLQSVAVIALGVCTAISEPAPAQSPPAPQGGSAVLPTPDARFGGIIGGKASESKPDFPRAVTAPKGAPNVLLILTDDTGFGASSTFGGPIPTPNLERIHQHGLCYNEFHTTALCSPTRAALLTGRNHHSVGFGTISEFATGYPGYDSILPKSAGTIGNILVDNGYDTSWFGKHHLIPDWQQSTAGPFDQWAGGLGFEYFYGFLGGDTDNWHPALFENNTPVLPPVGDPNYILIRDMTDRAINWIHMQHAAAPDKPFLMYFAPGNGHAPHHATKDWIAKFKGQFDEGWDKQRETTLANQKRLGVVPADTVLTPRPAQIPAWDSLNDDQKKVFARMMEVYAAAVAQSDYEIGRVIDAVEGSGQLDNTLVIYIEGDNGASAEGTLQGTTNEVGQTAPEPESHNVLPIDSSFADRANPAIRPNLNRGQTHFTYYPGMIRIPEASAPDVKNKSFRITADVEIPQGGADGILVTQGGRFGGWALLLLDKKPCLLTPSRTRTATSIPSRRNTNIGSPRLIPSHPVSTPSRSSSPMTAGALARAEREPLASMAARWPRAGSN